jgi:hypothetical protein
LNFLNISFRNFREAQKKEFFEKTTDKASITPPILKNNGKKPVAF